MNLVKTAKKWHQNIRSPWWIAAQVWNYGFFFFWLWRYHAHCGGKCKENGGNTDRRAVLCCFFFSSSVVLVALGLTFQKWALPHGGTVAAAVGFLFYFIGMAAYFEMESFHAECKV